MIDMVSKEPICKGWSCDQKYCVTATDGTKYLLRITPKEKAASRPECFRMQQAVATLGVPMCLPIECGKCAEGFYILQSWIDGKDAEEMIPTLSDAEQYAYGLDAGKILQKIHSIPAPPEQPDWEARFNAKINRKIEMYATCPLTFGGDRAMLRYLENNRSLLRGRPQCFQHGDYHIGNMMIDENGALQIIDFDRFDFGDPWEEFNRIVWSAQASPRFASGMVDGYFENGVPPEFWELLLLYICSNTLGTAAWALGFGEREKQTMLRQAAEIMRWYDDMQTVVPKWYQPL